jgi:hypothetical protein
MAMREAPWWLSLRHQDDLIRRWLCADARPGPTERRWTQAKANQAYASAPVELGFQKSARVLGEIDFCCV